MELDQPNIKIYKMTTNKQAKKKKTFLWPGSILRHDIDKAFFLTSGQQATYIHSVY